MRTDGSCEGSRESFFEIENGNLKRKEAFFAREKSFLLPSSLPRLPTSIEHFFTNATGSPFRPCVDRQISRNQKHSGGAPDPFLFKAFGRGMGKPFSPKRVPHSASFASLAPPRPWSIFPKMLSEDRSVCLPTNKSAETKNIPAAHLILFLFKAFGRGMGKPFSPKRVPHIASLASPVSPAFPLNAWAFLWRQGRRERRRSGRRKCLRKRMRGDL